MAKLIQISDFTLTTLLFFFLLLLLPFPIISVDITQLLSSYPDLSTFTSLLKTTSVDSDLLHRSSLTLLTVPNSFLHPTPPLSPTLPDVLRYNILLEYLSIADLHLIPPTGKLVTTLFQTTGRATANSGTINITFDPSTAAVTFHSPTSNATLLSPIKTLPYNISILSLNSLLIPYDVDLMASETRPTLGVNITQALINGHDFNVAASMLSASGVVSEFEGDETGAGITLFIPTDVAFADLPRSVKFQSLPAGRKAMVLRYHVLHCYYPLGSLEAIVNPVEPTLATEQNGAGSFTLNITRVNGSLGIDTGIVQASVTQTVFDQNPLAIFGVSKVLLPKEYFGGESSAEMNAPPNQMIGDNNNAQPPDIALSPGNYQPNHLSAAAPGMEIPSSAVVEGVVLRIFLSLWCIGLSYSLL